MSKIARAGLLTLSLLSLPACLGLFVSSDPSGGSATSSAGANEGGGSGNGGGASGGSSTTPVVHTPKNLQVNIDFLDRWVWSSNTVARTFERSRVPLDTNYYDGTVTYTFEILARNSNGGTAYTVELVDNSDVTVASKTIPASTSTVTRYSVPLTPTAGANSYRIKLPQTTGLGEVAVTGARILIKQVGATKTRLFIPLASDQWSTLSELDNNTGVFSTASASPTQGANSHQFIRLNNNFTTAYATLASGNSFTLEGVASITGAGFARVGLKNETSGNMINAAQGSTMATTPTAFSTDFSSTATDFDANAQLSLYAWLAGGTTMYLYRAGLWVTLDPIDKAEIYNIVGPRFNTGISGIFNYKRFLYDASLYSNPRTYAESTSSNAAVSSLELFDFNTSDSASAGANVIGSSFNPGGALTRLRSGELNLTSGNRYGANLTTGGPAYNCQSLFLIVTIE